MEVFNIEPKVDQTQEFLEIANDFSNPLELVREAISNSFDANASKIHIYFYVESNIGEDLLVIGIKDDGHGMNKEGLQSFFDLGNSLRRNDVKKIGEKGHGTKVYFNSSYIEIKTNKDGKHYKAHMNEPYKKLYNREIPIVNVECYENHISQKGTEIIIKGYNNNRMSKFTHDRLKDYIYWFTKFGSVEREFGIEDNKDVKIYLKGLDRENIEELTFGHVFPEESRSVEKLFEEHLVQAPSFYCKKITKKGYLKNFPYMSYEAVFSIEGNKVKHSNPMVRRSGYQAPEGAYTVQDRYGLWLCKDYIPIQRKNQWITKKGSEYTKFHAFVNCQNLKLTANRGSVENTPQEILLDIEKEIVSIYEQIISSDDWVSLEWLEDEAVSYKTVEREKKEFDKRIDKVNKSNIAYYKDVLFVEPQRESGVYALIVKLSVIEPNLFPFNIIDYDTHIGIDVIVKDNNSLPIKQSKLYYVEFKNYLIKDFNHSFENLHSIICWDIDIKNGEIVKDINNEERILRIISPQSQSDYTKYYLDNPTSAFKIEIYVLKDYLKQRLGIEFRPRTNTDVQ